MVGVLDAVESGLQAVQNLMLMAPILAFDEIFGLAWLDDQNTVLAVALLLILLFVR